MNSPDFQLCAVVLELQPITEIRLPISHGNFAYTALLDLFLRLHPTLSNELHQFNSHKPFTVSPLWGNLNRQGNDYLLSPEESYRWRLSGLTAEISGQLPMLLPEVGGVRIGPAVFMIKKTIMDTAEDPESGHDTYEDTWRRWQDAALISSVTLKFSTPTTFRFGKWEQPFPLPRLVFHSIIAAWNEFAPFKLEEIEKSLEEKLVLSNWSGETRRVEFGEQRTVGFIGKFTYRMMDSSKELSQIIGTLADYSFYSGVGWQTTHGLGQVRPEFRFRK